jgi:tetratricopeptide (TPR) repeat protein
MSSNLIIKGVLGLAILAFIIVVLVPRSVVIEPISVPKDMEERGYTPNVAALHLLDAMNKYAVRARTSGAGPNLALHKDPADFVLPFVGVSFKAVVEWILTFVRIEGRQNISGEIMRVGQELKLRLRKNGGVVYESAVRIPQGPDRVDATDLKKDLKEALEALFDGAALGVFANTDPYFEAVANSDKNPEAAFDLAKRIIADWPASDQNVVWAHNLLGLLLYQKGKLDGDTGAVAEFKKMRDYAGLWDDARVATAHLNLGLAYNEQGRTDEAVNEFQSAIRIRPELGTAHQLLGDVFDQMGDVEKAGCEYLEAIAKFHQTIQTMVSNRFLAVAHQRLGTALNNWDKAKTANCPSHGKSERKDPVSYDTVIAEYQRAAELDPDDAHIHYDLGSKFLESPSIVGKSIEELDEALKRHEGPSKSFDEFKYVLLKALSHALRIKTGNRKALTDCTKGKFKHREDELFCRAFRDNEDLIERTEKRLSSIKSQMITRLPMKGEVSIFI